MDPSLASEPAGDDDSYPSQSQDGPRSIYQTQPDALVVI